MKNFVLIVIILLFLPFMSFSQNSENDTDRSNLNLSRFIELKQSGSKEVIIIDIDKNTAMFEYLIETSITSGKLTIEILNPNNERKGFFSVGTQLNLVESEIAKGSITDSFSMPIEGEWKIIFKPELASGEISIHHSTKLVK